MTDAITTMTVQEFHDAIKAQGVSSINHAAFVCPMCGCVQSMADFVAAGCDPKRAENLIAFSCIGRVIGAGSPRKEPDGKPCNWTLGGLFQLHTLEVVTDDGEKHPRFALATSKQARAHEKEKA